MILGTIRTYAELMRVANVFTAVSNVWMGMVFTTGGLPGWAAVGITATSALLYLAGMVLNDVFDHRIDAKERPERPIPSGRVSLSTARLLGWGLLGAGVATGWATSLACGVEATGAATTLLAIGILIYDGGVKNTRFGPLMMALCRFMNVELGYSLVLESIAYREGSVFESEHSLIPAQAMALYILGVTWFARSEATESKRPVLATATLVSMAGLLLLAAMPWLESPLEPPLQIQQQGWVVLWIVVIGTILRRMVVAILQPSPRFVQRAVGHAVLSIIVVDAAICLGFAGPFWALAVLALLAPAALLAQVFKVS